MKRILLSIALLAALSGIAAAADKGNPALLCDGAPPVAKPAVCEPAPVCPPPAPICAPEPVCATPAPQVCDTRTVTVPVKSIVTETKVVPVKRRIVEDEDYTVLEARTGSYLEPRTRMAKRTVDVPTTKVVSEAKYRKVEPCSGYAPRVSRKVQKKVVPTTVKVTEEFEEEYLHETKYAYNVPVTKTRKVKKTVEEYKTVSVPRTVTTMETRVVGR